MRIIKTVVGTLALAGIVWSLGLASYHERLAIRDIAIEGESAISERTLKTAIDAVLYDGSRPLFSKTNMFLYPRRTLIQSLKEEFPRIDTVSVARPSLLAQAVVVSVTERQPRHTWCDKDERCFVLDESGFIFDNLQGDTIGYVFRGGLVPNESPIGQTFLRSSIGEVLELLHTLNTSGYAPRGVIVESDTDMSVSLAEGFGLKVSFGLDPSAVVRNLKLVLDSGTLKGKIGELEYVDLRFGNRVYYKFDGQPLSDVE